MSFFVSGSRPQFDNLGAIRWRAPEFISRGTVSFEADVYSLGMCIVEAVSGKMPWPTIPDIAVKWHLKEGTFLRQPKEMSRVEWALVCEMCTFEPSRRLKLAQVERRINRFVAMEIDESSRLQFSGSNEHQGKRLSAYQQ
ncbi:hypothetical protein JG687_00012367 [Phytophthora cactorum]|uniref:Protein kinase domain-containing protein n=1 Tax=Phytophthora cactorum TaxID=29920 RepID=A0A8T1U3B8_9STRA|nr:hypothetical protein JG687_00012367 [Phytophthora cactorum]